MALISTIAAEGFCLFDSYTLDTPLQTDRASFVPPGERAEIVLHLCEHVRRNAMYLTRRDASFSRGIEEHFPDLLLPPEELVSQVEQTFGEWRRAMKTRIRQTLSGSHRDEVDPENEMHRVYHLVEHTGYHLGQIVDRAKRISGRSFGFVQGGLNERQLRERINRSRS